MTITILSSGAQLDLPIDTKLNIETTSPIFSNASSMSLPISLPLTAQNRRALNHPDILNIYDTESASVRTIPDMQVVVKHGSWHQMATLSISGCSETAIEATLYFNESNIWSKIEEMTLPQAMAGLHYGDIPPTSSVVSTYRQNLFNALYADFQGYPTFIDKRENDHYQGEISYEEWEQMLEERATWFQTREFVMAPIHTEDGWLNKIWYPRSLQSTTNFLYITAFLRLDYVLHKIFEKAGYTLTIDFDSFPDADAEYESFFEYQWHSIVLLNNTMDALYPGCLYYSALVPDITCKEFLLAVCAQFGCAFFYQPDGSYKMQFLQSILSTSVGKTISEFSGQQVTFNTSPDYSPKDNLEKLTKANMIYSRLPNTQYDNDYSSGHDGWDNYPTIHTISLDGVCQRTTTTATDGEDSTKDKKCPLTFVSMDFAFLLVTDYDQSEHAHISEDTYPALRRPSIEIFDYEHNQGHTEDISRELYAMYFAEPEGLFHMLNKSYEAIAESCDKINITRMLTINELSSFDFTQPIVIHNRLCYPSKLQYELRSTKKQQVLIELIAPHKL